jgi:hypothetical protein
MTRKQEDRIREYESEGRSRGESANITWKEATSLKAGALSSRT